MRRIAIINQKGGCGKTTTAINLAGVFAHLGRRTLLVDMDPQAHCAAGLAIPEQRIDVHIGQAMVMSDPSALDRSRLLWRISRNLDLAPSTMALASLEAARGDLASRKEPERCLRRVLDVVQDDYDACLIDCSPAIGLLAFNAIVAADELIIPVETGFFSLQGATKQVSTIRSLGKRLGVAPEFNLLPTMHDPASALANDLLHELRRRFPDRVAPVVIRTDPKLREAVSFGQPVIEYDPDSSGGRDYSALGRWLLDRVPEHEETSPTGLDIRVVTGIGDRIAPIGRTSESPEPNVMTPPPPAPHAPPAPPITPEVPGATDDAAGQVAVASPAATRAADVAARAMKLRNQTAAEELETEQAPTPTPAPLPPTSALPLYGSRATPDGVLFVQPLSLGRQVCIAYDRNGWSADANPMIPHTDRGVFELVLPFDSGMRHYRLVVDGQWMPDPYNPLMAPNPFGDSNSVVIVPDRDDRESNSTT